MSNTDPDRAPLGTVWLAVVCETGEEHLYPQQFPVLKVGTDEWHGIGPDHAWFRAEGYMVHHRETLYTPSDATARFQSLLDAAREVIGAPDGPWIVYDLDTLKSLDPDTVVLTILGQVVTAKHGARRHVPCVVVLADGGQVRAAGRELRRRVPPAAGVEEEP